MKTTDMKMTNVKMTDSKTAGFSLMAVLRRATTVVNIVVPEEVR
jgi:hypothetical protein